MNFSIENLGPELEVTVNDLQMQGDIDEWLFENSLDACEVKLWRTPGVAIFCVQKNLSEHQQHRLLQVLRRFGFSADEMETFIVGKLIPHWIRRDTAIREAHIEDRGELEAIKASSGGMYGDFDERMFFNAMYCCAISATYEQLTLVVEIPKMLLSWQAARIAAVLRRYNFSEGTIENLEGIRRHKLLTPLSV
jgi:hypothetical protein